MPEPIWKLLKVDRIVNLNYKNSLMRIMRILASKLIGYVLINWGESSEFSLLWLHNVHNTIHILTSFPP